MEMWPRGKFIGGIGFICVVQKDKEVFTDLGAFNKTLIAKQVRRLLSNPSSLVCRILKDKYFPHCDILEAEKVKGSLAIWQNLM